MYQLVLAGRVGRAGDQFSMITDISLGGREGREGEGGNQVAAEYNSSPELSHCSALCPAAPDTRQELDISGRMVAKSKSVFEITPHKRRGPIAAEFSTPGPASIALPGLIGSK